MLEIQNGGVIVEENKKNKAIIGVSVIALVVVVFIVILLNSQYNGTFAFHYINNLNTGRPLSAFVSVLLYILLWWVISLIPAASVALFSLVLYFILHRKDKRLLQHNYHPPYESEHYWGARIAFFSTYVAVLMLMILQISNLVSINVF